MNSSSTTAAVLDSKVTALASAVFVLFAASACARGDVRTPAPSATGSPSPAPSASPAPVPPVAPTSPGTCRVLGHSPVDGVGGQLTQIAAATTWFSQFERLQRLSDDARALETVLSLPGNILAGAAESTVLVAGVLAHGSSELVHVSLADPAHPAIQRTTSLGPGAIRALWSVGDLSVAILEVDAALTAVAYRGEERIASVSFGRSDLVQDGRCGADGCELLVAPLSGPTERILFGRDGHVARFDLGALRDLRFSGAGLAGTARTASGPKVFTADLQGGNLRLFPFGAADTRPEVLTVGHTVFVFARYADRTELVELTSVPPVVERLPFGAVARLSAGEVDGGILFVGISANEPSARAVLRRRAESWSSPIDLVPDVQPSERRWLRAIVLRRGARSAVLLTTSVGDGEARLVQIADCR